jgi:hypothetical protein
LKEIVRLEVSKAWECLGDKVQIVDEVIKFMNNRTQVDLEVLGIKDIIAFIMKTSNQYQT